VEEGFAVEREKLLYLRDPNGLLEAWVQKYSGPAEQLALYFRGDVTSAERNVGNWCQQNGLQYALAGYSAAWRLAPEVRYSVGSIYVENRGFDRVPLEQLANEYGGKRVDSGPTLLLYRPYDESVFAGLIVASSDQPVTSALQTFLDLTQTAGRGEDAVNAVFEKHLKKPLQAAAKLEAERQSGSV
jgi:Transcriptional regulator, AbiEi antitoxin, Type IV TA system